MKENVLKQMIAAVDKVVKQNKSDFYQYDLHSLSELETPEFFWSVRETGTELLVIDRSKMLERLRANEQCRFSFMRRPNQVVQNFLYFPGVKTFHCGMHSDTLEEIENPKGAIYFVWNDTRRDLMYQMRKEFGDKEENYWHAYMRVNFRSPDIWREIYKAIHTEGGESLLQILKSFRGWERGAVNEEVIISGDWSPNSFSFCHRRNDECVMNGGILFYDGKWHRHT